MILSRQILSIRLSLPGQPRGIRVAERRLSLVRGINLQVVFLLLAWFAATGAQWDAVQLVAWGRMFLENSSSMSIELAAEKTFEPGSSCRLCEIANQAKQSESSSEAPIPGQTKVVVKQLLFLQSALVPVHPEMCAQEYPMLESKLVSYGRAEPPSPPPKV